MHLCEASACRSERFGQRDDSATVKIETAAYGAITAAHERVLRARLSPHRQDCVDFGRTLADPHPRPKSCCGGRR